MGPIIFVGFLFLFIFTFAFGTEEALTSLPRIESKAALLTFLPIH